MFVRPLFIRFRAENASIKWPVRVTPLKKHHAMLVGAVYTRSQAENASIRCSVWVTPLKEPQSMLAGPLGTRSRAESASINLPGRATPLEKKQSMLITTSISIFSLAVGFVRFRCLLGFPSVKSMMFPPSLNVAPQHYTQSCRCFHRCN